MSRLPRVVTGRRPDLLAVSVLAVVAVGDPIELGGEQLDSGPHSRERGVQPVVGRSVAEIGDQHVGGRLPGPAGQPGRDRDRGARARPRMSGRRAGPGGRTGWPE